MPRWTLCLWRPQIPPSSSSVGLMIGGDSGVPSAGTASSLFKVQYFGSSVDQCPPLRFHLVVRRNGQTSSQSRHAVRQQCTINHETRALDEVSLCTVVCKALCFHVCINVCIKKGRKLYVTSNMVILVSNAKQSRSHYHPCCHLGYELGTILFRDWLYSGTPSIFWSRQDGSAIYVIDVSQEKVYAVH